MLYTLASLALAAEPASIDAPPPSGADLERVEDGWRFTRSVEIDGHLIEEEGLSVDGRVVHLRWSAGSPSAETLAAWHADRAPALGCEGTRDRWIAVRNGVIYTRTAHPAEHTLTIEETLDKTASCSTFSPHPPPAPPTPKAPPPPKALAITAITPRSPTVASDPPPEIARRIQIVSSDLSSQPLTRIAGWCLSEHPAAGTFRWADRNGSWQLLDDARSPAQQSLASCLDAMLAPMPAKGTLSIQIR